MKEGRKEEVTPYIEALRETVTTPILFVSHSLTEVARLASNIIVMREGRALRAGPLDVLLADPAFAPVIGPSMAGAVLSGRAAAQLDDGLTALDLGGGAQIFLPGVAAPMT